MFNVALYEPEIPPNTGNIIRLCANTGAQLHLIEPLGFTLDDKRMRRAGLDYHEFADVKLHSNLTALKNQLPEQRVLACSTRGTQRHDECTFQAGDILLFGPETRGLPQAVLNDLPKEQVLRLPMRAGNRSLNLSNAVAIILYEAWRQIGFAGAD
ncbi:MAG: tRNA (uridine(34)/cytosine(34)/5-carboxymethylaminomethyluridine(34)-2'-O)-methyltransferase TrmL [Salinisphaeraceae bacterium]|nr:tRNA (uridine(34)/cytosine(34)/5-carboxymethylaminomethyluridine(34)-2'-O)-methyltransferase TrmL [Salinisphaeraceae bacterium]